MKTTRCSTSSSSCCRRGCRSWPAPSMPTRPRAATSSTRWTPSRTPPASCSSSRSPRPCATWAAFLAAQKLPLDPAARGQAADRIAQVALQARLLSEVAGGDAGAAALTEALAGVLTEDRVRTLGRHWRARWANSKRAAQDGQPADRARAAAGAAALAHTAQSILQCLAVTQAAELLLLVEEICARIADGGAGADGAARLGHAVRRRGDRRARRKRDVDLDEGAGRRPRQRIRGALQPDKQAGESEQLDAMLAGLKERPDDARACCRPTMSASSRRASRREPMSTS